MQELIMQGMQALVMQAMQKYKSNVFFVKNNTSYIEYSLILQPIYYLITIDWSSNRHVCTEWVPQLYWCWHFLSGIKFYACQKTTITLLFSVYPWQPHVEEVLIGYCQQKQYTRYLPPIIWHYTSCPLSHWSVHKKYWIRILMFLTVLDSAEKKTLTKTW